MRLRSRLRRSQVAQAVDPTDFRPSRNSGGGVPVAAHSLQECRRAIARRRRQFAHLEFLDPLCGMVQVCRRPTHGGRINPRCGDPDRRTGIVRLRTACASAARVAEPSLGLSHFSTPYVCMAQEHGRPTHGGRAKGRCGDANQRTSSSDSGKHVQSSMVDWKSEARRECAVRVVRFRTSNVEYRCSPALHICGCECCACVLCVCRRVRVLFRVCARVNVRDHVCVHASSCYGHVCAVRVAGFRTSNVEYRCSAALRMCGWEYCV
jgi:hypothetical protein